jgi:CysZ protein
LIRSLTRAFAQLPDPRFRSVVLRGVLWCVALFAVLFGAVWWLIDSTQMFGISWLEWAVDALGWTAAIITCVVLFPGAVLTILTFMLEDVAAAVEARYYPGQAPPRRQPFMEILGSALRLAGVVLALNLLFLPVYLVLFFLPPINLFVFYGLNGYLLGREYFELVAYRRLDSSAVRELQRRNRGRLFWAGVVIALLLTIPLVNWLMPVVATAFMLHMFEMFRDRPETV